MFGRSLVTVPVSIFGFPQLASAALQQLSSTSANHARTAESRPGTHRSTTMPDPVLPQAQPLAFDTLMRARGQALRAKDQPPMTVAAWQTRRTDLRRAILEAMGPEPEKACPLDP